MIKRYRSVHELAAAMRRGEVPENVYSPGHVARMLRVSRQAVHNRIERGTLDAYRSEDVVLVVFPAGD